MQKLPLLLFLAGLVMFHLDLRAQDTGAYAQLDTLIYYDAGTASGPFAVNCSTFTDTKKQGITYYVNCREVSKAEYDKYHTANKSISECKPCVLKHYNTGDTLLAVTVQYTDCRVGKHTEYYPDGKVKVSGQYRQNDTGNWKNIWKRGYCSVKEGTWTYYNPDGTVSRTETYKKGKPVK